MPVLPVYAVFIAFLTLIEISLICNSDNVVLA